MKQITMFIRQLLTVIVVLLFLGACNTDNDKKVKVKKGDVTTAEKPAQISKIHFFLETSASMGGYLKGNTTFKNVVSDVVTKSKQIAPLSVYTITSTPQAYTGDVMNFIQDLATTPLANGKSSKLHTIFGQVGAKVTGNEVAVLVSDCILSFPDADIKKQPEINRNNASSVLKSQINDQFATLSRKGMGAMVYAFNSPFNGTYYDYQNKKTVLYEEQRPFYVWIIGKQSLVADFNRQLQERLSEKPAQQLNFGAGEGLKKYDLFFSLNKKGKWKSERGNVTEIKFSRKAEPAEFAIGLDLSGLPVYAQSAEYLKSNLVLKSENATLKLTNVQRRENVNTTKIVNNREQQLLSHNSHVLTFKIENLIADDASVSLRLPVRFDTWYETDWSTMDDRTEAGRRRKTFALVHLMNGVREAYQSNTNDFVNFTFNLEK